MEVCSINKIFNLFILISLVFDNKILIESYSQVSRVGAIVSNSNSSNNNDNNSTNSEIIKHNPGREGVFSMSEYNDDDEITTIENKSSEVFTGRSSPSMGGFQFPLNFNTKPISYRRPSMAKSNLNPNEKPSSSPIFVYPSSGSKSIDQTNKYSSNLPPPSTAEAMDRFSPGEAYGFQQYQINKNKMTKGYDYTPPKIRLPDKPAPSSPVSRPPAPPVPQTSAPLPPGPVYTPPKDLYSFPPNNDANYLPPSMKGNESPVTSYLPPPAGVLDSFDSNSYAGPVNPKYLSPSNAQNMPPGMGMSDSGGMEMDSPPPSSDDQPPTSGGGGDYHDHDHHDHGHDHSHDHSHDSPELTATESPLNQMMTMIKEALKNNNDNIPSDPLPPSPPTGSDTIMSSPDYDHFHHPHHDHDFHGQYGVDASPEVVYDHDPHDHDHGTKMVFSSPDHDFHGHTGPDAYSDFIYDHYPHDHHHDIVVTTTEAPPPPEEPMDSRVTKYSYYYLGRKLWYVPLYFTLYFTFYVASLIVRSIGRHKVDFPNHFQKRSTDNMSHKDTVRKVEKLTNFVMKSIEDFKVKYL